MVGDLRYALLTISVYVARPPTQIFIENPTNRVHHYKYYLQKRTMHRHHVAVASLFALLLAGSAECAIITLNFEGFPDGTTLTNQYSGVNFTNTTVLKAGFSLNEFEFPPHSGTNVASDTGGPISISFATPATSFAGYFTYLMPLTLTAFNAANSPVGSITSKFANNLACLAGPPCSGTPAVAPMSY